MTTFQAAGAHFAGSILAPDEASAFTLASTQLPQRLRRVPDGEPGNRSYWCWHQHTSFGDLPAIYIKAPTYNAPWGPPDPAAIAYLEQRIARGPAETGYDVAAIASYAIFADLQARGVIPRATRFQVSLPTSLAVMASCFLPEYREMLEEPYMRGLLDAISRIQDAIPPAHLAIQFDIAAPECSILEYAAGHVEHPPLIKAWWGDARAGVFERLLRLAGAVRPGVELGFHLCYGDLAHAHFKQPKDAWLLDDIATALVERIPRRVDFVHMPVPQGRDDVEFFKPLGRFQARRGETELYLGLVHPGDEEGTRRRMEAARQVVWPFGVGTECGMGRTPEEHKDSILEIMRNVSDPVV